MDKISANQPQFQVYEGQYKRIRVRKQDVLVLEFPEELTPGQKSEAFEAMEKYFPGNKVLLLDGGVKLFAISHMSADDENRLDETDETND